MVGIYCAGSLGSEITDILVNDLGYSKRELIYIDDVILEETIDGIKKYSFGQFINTCAPGSVEGIVIATGEPKYRRILRKQIQKKGYRLLTVVSTKAYVCNGVVIGEGSVIFPLSYIGRKTQIEKNVIVHVGAKVEGNCKVKNDSFISLGAFLGADGEYGEQTFVGPNTTIIDHVRIGKGAVIGMGSVVTKDIEKNGVYVGNPARFIRENKGRVFKNNLVSV